MSKIIYHEVPDLDESCHLDQDGFSPVVPDVDEQAPVESGTGRLPPVGPRWL